MCIFCVNTSTPIKIEKLQQKGTTHMFNLFSLSPWLVFIYAAFSCFFAGFFFIYSTFSSFHHSFSSNVQVFLGCLLCFCSCFNLFFLSPGLFFIYSAFSWLFAGFFFICSTFSSFHHSFSLNVQVFLTFCWVLANFQVCFKMILSSKAISM